MVKIEIQLKNEKAILNKFNMMPQKVAQNLQIAIGQVGAYASGKAKLVITSGIGMWKSPIDTGQMRQGIQSFTGRMKATIKTSKRTPYAIYVHEGTRKMRARPFFEITVKEEKRDIEKFFNKALERAIK